MQLFLVRVEACKEGDLMEELDKLENEQGSFFFVALIMRINILYDDNLFGNNLFIYGDQLSIYSDQLSIYSNHLSIYVIILSIIW